jgi:hypothetical protein
MTTETKWFIIAEDGMRIEEFDTEADAKQSALDCAEEYEQVFIVFKGQSVWLAEPPIEIPAKLSKIKAK